MAAAAAWTTHSCVSAEGLAGCTQGVLPPKMYQQAKVLVLSAGLAVLALVASLVVGYVMASPTFGWTGVDPARAARC